MPIPADHLKPPEVNAVEEFQGLFGSFTFSEKSLQKIWARRSFNTAAARTLDGRRLEILFPGKWNLLGGPDFRQARLRLDGRDLFGDVEIHFRAADWFRHGHDRNPAFAQVILHVLLFRPDPGEPLPAGPDGAPLASLVLLDLLARSLEEHAADEALESLARRSEWPDLEPLAALALAARRLQLFARAQARWRQKVGFAAARIGKLGWEEAAHQTALEILGYGSNRGAMLALAARIPFTRFQGELPSPEEALAWSGVALELRGCRPANHPRLRLQQYRAWLAACPNWPGRLLAEGALRTFPPLTAPACIASARRGLQLSYLRRRLAQRILGEAVPAPRIDNLFCDGFFPLLAAATGREWFGPWFYWRLGDLPGRLKESLRIVDIAGPQDRLLCHGWGQGILGWLLEFENRSE